MNEDLVINIDFSLYCTPTTAFGAISGEVIVKKQPEVGDHIKLLNKNFEDWFPARLRVVSINKVPHYPSIFAVGLQDIVAPSEKSARKLIKILQDDRSLFFDEY